MSVCARIMFSLVLVLVLSIFYVDSFNVDTVNFVRHHGPQTSSMFGFSVAIHQHSGESWVLIGAPEAHTDQPGVYRGGAVYRCNVLSDDLCQELPFDRSGNNNNSQGVQIDKKSEQWFGATVHSAGVDGPIVACAPRYVFYSTSENRRDPVGTCYVARGDFSQYTEYAPCRTRGWGYHRQGSCQAGLGAAISKDGKRLFIGAPGSWYWQGQLFSQALTKEPNVVKTQEGPTLDDDSYMGYSVASGDFTGDGEAGVAVGMPRGSNLFGKIVLYSWNLINYQNISGEQLGAYFGYCIAVADVDGDDYDDLLIGAPLYTIPNTKGKYENGRVYVFYQRSSESENLYRKHHVLDGLNSKGRFGLSLSSLGDINLDNYDDFVVGAPYDGPEGNGAVYIYHGSATGVRDKPSQVIFAEDLHDGFVSTFGFSVSGGIDIDGNEYPDMVVGAYEASKAIVFKSRPVVKMDAVITFGTQSKQINLDERNCTLRNKKKVPCTTINTCLEFRGVGVGENIDLDVQYFLDSKKTKQPRLFFLTYEGQNVINETKRLEHSKRICQEMIVYIKDDVRDKLTPLEVEMKYSMQERTEPFVQRRQGRSALYPILDLDTGLVKKDSISIQKNCGGDNICIPDLRIIATPSVTRFLLGSKEKLKIDVQVQNEGEDAFEAMFNLRLPPGINYVKIERRDDSQTSIRIQCSAPKPQSNNTLKCDIGNPLPKEKVVQFLVVLDPFYQPGMKPSYDFYMEVNSTNPENKTLSDNTKHMSVGIWIETDFVIEGISKPQEEIYFNTSQYTETNVQHESQIGQPVIHIYNIRNNGPSNIEEAEIFLTWPMKTLGDETLMYVLEEPETSGPIKCEYITAINEYNLKLEPRKSYLELYGIATANSEWTSSRRVSTKSDGVTIEETYSGSSSSSRTSGGGKIQGSSRKHFTAEERKKQDEDENAEETGDASLVHIRRVQEKHRSGGGSSDGGGEHHITVTGGDFRGGSESRGGNSRGGQTVYTKETKYTSHWNSSSENGGAPRTYSWSRNASSVTGPDGKTKHYITDSNDGDMKSESDITNLSVGSGGARQSIHYTSSRGGSSGAQGSRIHSTSSHKETSEGSSGTQWNSNQLGAGEQSGGTHSRTGGQWSHGESTEHAGGHRRGGGSTRVSHTSWTSGNAEESSQGTRNQQHGSQLGNNRNVNVTKHYFKWDAEGKNRLDSTEDAEPDTWSHEEGVVMPNIRTVNSGYISGSEEARRGGSYSGTVQSRESHARGHHEDGITVAYAAKNRTSSTNSRNRGSGRDRTTYGQYDHKEYDSSLGLGNAAIGGGFRTTSLDLGQLPNSGEHDLAHHSGGSSSKIGGSTQYGVSYSSGERSGQGQVSGSYDPDLGYARTFDKSSGENVRRTGGGSSRTHSSSWSSHSESGHSRGSGDGRQGQRDTRYESHYSTTGDNVPTEVPQNVRGRYSRSKRESDSESDNQINDVLDCKATKCAAMRCVVGPLDLKHPEVWLALRSRINATTVRNIFGGKPVSLSSMMVARITKLPYIGKPTDQTVKTHEVFTTIIPKETDAKPDVVPLWVVVLSAVAGTIILLLLCYVLYKCGFFKRNRPSDAPERQPLNRNGHYQHGDEQL